MCWGRAVVMRNRGSWDCKPPYKSRGQTRGAASPKGTSSAGALCAGGSLAPHWQAGCMWMQGCMPPGTPTAGLRTDTAGCFRPTHGCRHTYTVKFLLVDQNGAEYLAAVGARFVRCRCCPCSVAPAQWHLTALTQDVCAASALATPPAGRPLPCQAVQRWYAGAAGPGGEPASCRPSHLPICLPAAQARTRVMHTTCTRTRAPSPSCVPTTRR